MSLLFDLFVTTQRVRRVLADAMAGSGMRPDEYAVYSLLLDHGPLTATAMAELLGMPLTTVLDYLKAMSATGHLQRSPHPTDGRALQLSLSRSGFAAQRRANAHWEVVRKRIEGGLELPIDRIRLALNALDDAADRAGASAAGSTTPRAVQPQRMRTAAAHSIRRARIPRRAATRTR